MDIVHQFCIYLNVVWALYRLGMQTIDNIDIILTSLIDSFGLKCQFLRIFIARFSEAHPLKKFIKDVDLFEDFQLSCAFEKVEVSFLVTHEVLYDLDYRVIKSET